MIEKSKIDAMDLCSNFLKENDSMLKKAICDAVIENKEITNLIIADKIELTKYNGMPALNIYIKVIEDGKTHTVFVHFLSFYTLLRMNNIDEIKDKCGKLVVSAIKRRFNTKEINIGFDFNVVNDDIIVKGDSSQGEFSIDDIGNVLQEILLLNEIRDGKISINMKGEK